MLILYKGFLNRIKFMKNISPEERLLKLIRGEKKAAELFPKEGTAVFSLERVWCSQKTFGIVKWTLFVLLFAACAYFIFCILRPKVYSGRFNSQKLPEESILEEELASGRDVKSIDAYLKDIGDRQIFNKIALEEPSKQADVVKTDAVKDINLLGIISGDNPQAILEDKNTQKTYYLNIGQSIADFVVEDIKDGRVILNYNGAKLELYM